MNTEEGKFSEVESPEKREKFSELIRYILPGYLLGLLAGISWTFGACNGSSRAIVCQDTCRRRGKHL